MTELNETCSCGAEFHWDDGTHYSLSARTAAQEWRETHHHSPTLPATGPVGGGTGTEKINPSWGEEKE